MIGIILSGHGNFATGMFSSLNLIVGEQKKLIPVDFNIQDTVETLEVKIKKAVDELKDCNGIVFLTDLAGGSPFKTCVMLSSNIENAEVIAGTNLGMLLEVSLSREGLTAKEIKNIALQSGKDSVKAYEEKKRKQVSSSGI